jgi:DNA-binding GntR family transcriptional regulator
VVESQEKPAMDDAALPGGPQGRLRYGTLKDVAAVYLREQILTGRLVPGTKVEQERISEELGISRLPVREALIELAQEGLIEAVPRRGAFVARLEREDIVDHYRIFGQVAGLAASRAAGCLDADQLALLRQMNASFGAATDPREQAHWNHEFHQLINRAGGSRRLRSVLALFSRSLPVRYFDFAPQWARTSVQDHARIIDALESRDAYEVQRMVEHHLAGSGALAVQILQDMGYWDYEVGESVESPQSGAA